MSRGLRDALVLEVRRPEARALALLAVEETASNIQEHGYGGESGYPLSILLRTYANGVFTVTLQDRAPIVDISRLAPGDLEELAQRHATRGRGVALVRVLSQRVTHRARKGGGNEVTLHFDVDQLSRVAKEQTSEAA